MSRIEQDVIEIERVANGYLVRAKFGTSLCGPDGDSRRSFVFPSVWELSAWMEKNFAMVNLEDGSTP
jgi:hypothetical protein